MAATVLFGGYLYLVPAATDSRRGVETLSDPASREFVQTVIQQFKDDTTLARELYTLRSAERKWGKDPFLKNGILLSDTPRRAVPENPPASVAARLNLVYTGFIEVGTQRLAIINDMEYASGESIAGQGYYVRRIQPRQVEICKRNAPDTIVLNLTEFEAGMDN